MSRAPVSLNSYSDPKRPSLKWQVSWPSADPGKPRRRKRFETKKAATEFRELKVVEILNAGRDGGAVHQRAVKEAAWAMQQLEPLGVGIRDVVDDYLKRHDVRNRSIGISDAVDEFLQAKHKDGASERYQRDLTNRLEKWATSSPWADMRVSDVTTKQLSEWLRKLKVSATTRNNFRRVIGVFLSWSVDVGYCETNPAKRTPQAKEPNKPVEIFTPGDLRVILEHAPTNLLPFLAIGAFAGLRSAEIARLDWQEIDFLRGHIEVTGAKAKTAQRRFVPLNDTLRHWLEPYAKATGALAPTNVNERLTKFHRLLASENSAQAENRPPVRWKQNGLRHSFASYAIAQEEDAARVALWLGHANPQMTFSAYRERCTAEEAHAWFGVTKNRERANEKAAQWN
jgi:integrase